MKLFHKLLLERIRTVLLLRHNPKQADTLLVQYGVEEKELLTTYAKDTKSPINSHLIIKMIEVSEYLGKSSIQELPLELLLLEHCA